MYKRLPLKRRERREKECAGCYFQLSLFCVFLCVVCLYYCAKRGICLSVRRSVFLLSCLFFLRTLAQKQKKRAKNWREKKIHSQTSSNDIRDQFSKDQIQRAVDKELLYGHSRSKMWWIFLPPIFCSFFFVFACCPQKNTHEREETHYDAQKDKFLFAQ